MLAESKVTRELEAQFADRLRREIDALRAAGGGGGGDADARRAIGDDSEARKLRRQGPPRGQQRHRR